VDDNEFRQASLDFASRQLVAQLLLYWRQLLESESRKSPLLPVLWGHKGHSQNEEDGIVLEIFRRIGIQSRTLVEIGVGNGIENNSLFWLKQGWRGAWIEGGAENSEFIRRAFANSIARGEMHFQQAMVSAGNINELIASTPFAGREIDLLSIDIDGNDYYVFEQLKSLNARVVVIEYNAKYPPPLRWRIPYSADYVWDGSDWFGASLQSLCDLFERRNYSLVGCNVTGSNAFFVRNDLLGDNFPCIGEIGKLYQPARYFMTGGLFNHLAGAPKVSVRLDGISEPEPQTRAHFPLPDHVAADGDQAAAADFV
jgi:hypothetical protein